MVLTTREIAEVLNARVMAGKTRQVRGVSIDTRTMQPGMLFFALSGEQVDGHRFVEKALDAGACGAVVKQQWFHHYSGEGKRHLFPVADPLLALQKLASYFRKKYQFSVIAVTGTNGKTTTKEMLARVLGMRYKVMKSRGNLNNHIGVPLSILSWEQAGEIAVVEMGTNHFGEIRRLCEIARPTHGIITNIGKGHIEFFHDLAGVARAKGEMLTFLKDTGMAFINGDDPHLLALKHVVKRTSTYGFSEKCDFQAKDLGVDHLGFPQMDIEGMTIKLALPGRYNLYNGLVAACLGRLFSISWEEIRDALETYRSIDRRMELKTFHGIRIINDAYNANPTSMNQMLETLNAMKCIGRKIVVFGDMLELGIHSDEEHHIIGERLKDYGVDVFFGFGEEMRIAVESARKAGLNEAYHFHAKNELIHELNQYVKANDCVLIKGSRGMQMEEVVEGMEKEMGGC